MSTRSESFGRLLKGAINSIAAYEGKTAPAIEDELGQQLGLAGSAIQRYKAGYLPPEPRAIALFAEAGVRRGFLARAWLQRFLQAARYPHPEALFLQLADALGTTVPGVASGLPTGTVALLLTDIAGSSQRWEQQPRAMERALERHDAILRQALDAFAGQVVKTVGDAFIAVFTTVPAALEAAFAAQRALQAEDWGPAGPLLVRMALHAGAPQLRDGDYFGPAMNRAARILSAGHGGQVLLSFSAQELARDLLPPEAALRDLGEHRLKDLGRPERIFQLVAPGLPAAFPPLNALDRFRHNLPPQATPLVGREAEAEQAGALLDEPRVRLLTLTGPGGIGKTRLALQVAAERLERYRDGVVFVPLAEVSDPAQVPAAISQALGVREQAGQPLLEQLQATLKPRGLLLLLDNFEQVVAAAPAVGAILAAAPEVQALVTSRETLKLYGEQEYAVPPLALPEAGRVLPLGRLAHVEAVRLFIERAQAMRPDFAVTAENAPFIAEICARLDGLPLAIELAAARSKLFPPRALLARLDQRLRLLSGGPRDLPARQQTLTNAIAWSYDLLDAAEQVVFARLAVFVGGCTLEAAEAVAGDDAGAVEGELAAYVPREAVLDGLSALVDRSLVRQVESTDGEPRFVMLETIRAFALERLAASGEERALRSRHARYFHDLTEHGMVLLCGPELPIWLRRQHADRANVRAALSWSLAGGDPALAVSIVGAVQSYWRWGYEAIMPERLTLLRSALASGAGTPWIQARARLTMANWEPDEGAVELLLGAASWHWERVDDIRIEAERLRLLASANAMTRGTRQSEPLLEQVVALPRVAGDEVTRAAALQLLAEEQLRQGNQDAARARYSEALAIVRAADCVKHTASALMIMALSLQVMPVEREEWMAEAELLLHGAGDARRLAFAYIERSILALAEGQYERAQAALDAARVTFPNEYDLHDDLWLEQQYAHLARARGDLDTARTGYRRILSRLPVDAFTRPAIWSALSGLAEVAIAAGEADTAARYYGMAASIFDAHPQRYTYVDGIAHSRSEQALAVTRAALGDEAFAAAFASGKALTLEQAVAEVLASSAVE